MKKFKILHRWFPPILMALVGARMEAQTRVWPLKPILELHYVSVLGIPYAPGSTLLKSALSKSKGDAETGKISLYVRERVETVKELYKGTEILVVSNFYWDLRKDVAVYRTFSVKVRPDGATTSDNSSDPFPPTATEWARNCVAIPGQWTNHHSIHAKCALMHTIIRQAKGGSEHEWFPRKATVGFRKETLPSDCNPVDRPSRWQNFGLTVPRGELVQLDLAGCGFKNEEAFPDGGWSLAFDTMPLHDR